MAIIGQIRQRSTLLIGIIGVAMVLFIAGDMLSSGSSLFNAQPTDVGVIAGKAISQKEFEQRVQNVLDQQYKDGGADENVKSSIRDRVWDDLLRENVLYKEYNELGITVSPEEIFYQVRQTDRNSILARYFFTDQNGQILEQFRDPATGDLDGNMVMRYLQGIFQNDQVSDWLPMERFIKEDRYRTKYFNLIKKGLYATNFEAEKAFTQENERIQFDYVFKPYSSIFDTEVSIEDSDLKAYYEKHKHEAEFQQKEESRDIEYVAFSIVPSQEDIDNARLELEDLVGKFKADTSDTDFVRDNSEDFENNYLAYMKQGSFPPAVDSLIYNGSMDTVIGPYRDFEKFKLTKVVGEKIAPDSADISHILIQIKPDDPDSSKAKAKADSLFAVIKAEDNFAEMALKHSDDTQSGQKGGELGRLSDSPTLAFFLRKAFDGETQDGDIYIDNSPSGIHLLKVSGLSEPTRKVKVATIDRNIQPSTKTYNDLYKNALKLSQSVKTGSPEMLAAGADSLGGLIVVTGIKQDDKTVSRLSGVRPLVRWIYAAEKGAVSDPLELENAFVVARLKEIKPKGTLPFEVKKEEIRIAVMEEKKGEILIEQMQGKPSLEDVSKAVGEPVEKGRETTFASFGFPGGANEAELIGALFSLNAGDMSKPLAGNAGVYVFKINERIAAPPADNIASDKNRLEMQLSSEVDNGVYDMLKEEAKIEDNRSRYY